MKQEKERRIWWHWQNLNKRNHREDGSGLRHGSAWLHIGNNRTFQLEWRFLCRCPLSIGVRWHGGMTWHIQIPLLLSIFLVLPIRTFIRGDRETEITFSEWTLRVTPFGKTMSWSSRDRWWVNGWRLNVTDFIFGRTECHVKIVSEQRAEAPMPEGMYPGTVKIEDRWWTRKRWPFGAWQRRISAWMDFDKGIPHAGKGENSWDCGDDALCGIGCSDPPTVEGVIGRAVAVSMERRRKYGMPSNLQEAQSS